MFSAGIPLVCIPIDSGVFDRAKILHSQPLLAVEAGHFKTLTEQLGARLEELRWVLWVSA